MIKIFVQSDITKIQRGNHISKNFKATENQLNKSDNVILHILPKSFSLRIITQIKYYITAFILGFTRDLVYYHFPS